jgi:hypothetical protein
MPGTLHTITGPLFMAAFAAGCPGEVHIVDHLSIAFTAPADPTAAIFPFPQLLTAGAAAPTPAVLAFRHRLAANFALWNSARHSFYPWYGSGFQ